jgi:hypothetical protein
VPEPPAKIMPLRFLSWFNSLVLFWHPIFVSANLNISYQFSIEQTPHKSFVDTNLKGLGKISAEFRFKLVRINRIAMVVIRNEKIKGVMSLMMAGVISILKFNTYLGPLMYP